MADDIEQQGIEHLENIEHELVEIKERTGGSRWNSLRNGLWQGAGAVVGSIVAVLLIGFLLSVFGFIPGLGDVGKYLQNAYNQARSR